MSTLTSSYARRSARLLAAVATVTAALVVITLPITVAVPAHADEPVELPGRIAFASDRNGDSDIFVMEPDGSGVTALTDESAWEVNPTWSADGTRIAFERSTDEGNAIVAMDADGTDEVVLTDGSQYDELGSFSPDGAIVFSRYDRVAYYSHLWAIPPDGSALVQLTFGDAHDYGPAFSPDGSQIAFMRQLDDQAAAVYVMNIDGTGLRRLTDPAEGHAGYVAWSPDGTLLTFVQYTAAIESDEIHVMDPLTAEAFAVTATAGWEGSPTFAPDMSAIAFDRDDEDAPEDIRVLLEDGTEINLTNDAANDFTPAWSPIA